MIYLNNLVTLSRANEINQNKKIFAGIYLLVMVSICFNARVAGSATDKTQSGYRTVRGTL